MEIRFFPGEGDKSFSITPVACSKIRVDPSRIGFHPVDQGVMSFLLDIRSKGETRETSEVSPNGIDFWDVDQLHLPDYAASKNLIVNPSFEAGLRYWGFPNYVHSAIPLKYTNVYELDASEAHSGSHSLRIKALPIRSPSSIGPFAVVEGALHVSVEAKGANLVAEDVFAGLGLYVDPFEKTDEWEIAKTAKRDLAVYELIKDESGTLVAMCRYVQGTQAGSGTDFLVPGRVQKAIEVKTSTRADGVAVGFIVPQNVFAPLILQPGNRFGMNLSLPSKNGGVLTLAPIRDFISPSEPGEIQMVMVVIDQ